MGVKEGFEILLNKLRCGIFLVVGLHTQVTGLLNVFSYLGLNPVIQPNHRELGQIA